MPYQKGPCSTTDTCRGGTPRAQQGQPCDQAGPAQPWASRTGQGRPKTQPLACNAGTFSVSPGFLEGNIPWRPRRGARRALKELIHEVGAFTEERLVQETKRSEAFANDNPTGRNITAAGKGRELLQEPQVWGAALGTGVPSLPSQALLAPVRSWGARQQQPLTASPGRGPEVPRARSGHSLVQYLWSVRYVQSVFLGYSRE